MRLCILFLFAFLLMGAKSCEKPLPNPAALDPIYQDQKKDIEVLEKRVAELDAKMAEYKKNSLKAPIRTGVEEEQMEMYYKVAREKRTTEEKLRLAAIRAEKRFAEIKVIYPKYFAEGKPWPDPEAFKQYQIERRLASAPKEWSPERRVRAYRREIEAKKAAAAAPPPAKH